MTVWEALLLLGGGGIAGLINAMAGGGSIVTVPLLVLAGVPGNDANGSNRVGILTSTITTVLSFHRQGVTAYRAVVPILLPVISGALLGSMAVSQLADDAFETVFGLLMLPILVISLRKPKERALEETEAGYRWSRTRSAVVFFFIGIYGGAVQAGVGLVLLAALTRAGFGLIRANVIKVLVNITMTAMALPVFVAQGNVRWGPAVVLAVGLMIGGWVGARIAVQGGERVIRWVMTLATVGLAAKLLGLFG